MRSPDPINEITPLSWSPSRGTRAMVGYSPAKEQRRHCALGRPSTARMSLDDIDDEIREYSVYICTIAAIRLLVVGTGVLVCANAGMSWPFIPT